MLIGASCTATLAVCVHPRFQGPSFRGIRAMTFSALGLMGLFPIIHQVAFWSAAPGGMPRPLRAAFGLEVLMGALYLFGAFLFAQRIPERWCPGLFDYALHSHNLFHFLVIAAACTHVEASLILLAWRDSTACAA